jgi:SAM-dependent methyltransferase
MDHVQMNVSSAARAIDILRCPSCWSDFMPEPLTGSLFDIDGFGTLTCECGIFPVIDGIPVLDRRHNEQRLVALLKQGAFSTATSECLMVDVQRAPRLLWLLWRLLRKFGVPNGLYERMKVCRTFREALRIGVPTASAYHEYLRCRFSDPTFVAGEWLLANTQPTSGWLLDVPAGAGHFSWVLRQRHPRARIVTADASFFFMMMVKRFIVPSATAICLDGNAPLPFKTDQFELAVSADGWHYLDAQALFLHELMRVKRPEANLVMLHAHNRAVPNYEPGRPFALDEIMRLLRQTHAGPAVALNERAVAARAWSREPGDWPFDHVADPHSPEFDLWIGELPSEIHRADDGDSSALGKWIVNPLYVRGSGGKYIRQFANHQYQQEFSDLTLLLPEEVYVDAAGVEAPFDLELARRRIILFVPEGY